jgi:YD repeat-containing protein
MLNRAIAWLVLIACWGVTPSWAQSTVRYVYDDLGRLVGVIDQNGDAATYNYDAVGNLLSITRATAASVSIIAFSPGHGSVGTVVKISGTGFSSTPSSNTVTFNGTAAAVSSASANELLVTVPSGATTGTIAVTAPAGSVTSAAAFTVTSGSLAPTITSFTPAVALPGTSVAVTGTNFDVVLANDRTRFNVVYGAVSSATTTTLSAPVPSNTGSGHITIATPYGTAVSSDDLIIPPPGFAVADVQVSGRIPFASATAVNVSTVNKIGLMLFDASPGHRLSVKGTNGVTGQVFGCDIFVNLLNPNTTTLTAPVCMEGSGFIDVVAAPVTGTYTILVDPANTVAGAVTLTLYDVPADDGGTIAPGGSAVTVSTSTPGQNGARTFSGTAGQRISLKGTNGLTGQILGCDVNVSILKPDKSVLAPATCMEGSGYIDVLTLPAGGTYTIKVDPVDIATGSLTLTLYDVPADVTGSITPGGDPVTVTTEKPGQNAALTFSGTTGDRISLRGTNGMTGQIAFACDVYVSILKPDSTVLTSPICMEGSGFIDVTTLPATGTYTINIDPASLATGSLTLTLYSVPADVGGTITPGVSNSVTVTTTKPGQNGALTFSGTAGQRISVQGTNGMTGQIAFACDVYVSILNPNGSTLASQTCMEGSGFIDRVTLGTTGTYTIKVDPADIAVGSLTLTLHDVPADQSGSLTVGGSSLTLTTTTPGQNASATFSGTSSQQVTVHVTSNGMGSVTVKLLKPDGTQLTSTTSSASSFNLATQTLPTTGTYTILIDPGGTGTGSITVSVTNP